MCEFQLNMKMPGYFQGVQGDINRNTACDSVRQDAFYTILVRGGNFFDNIEQFVSCHQKEPCAFKHFKKICKFNTGGYCMKNKNFLFGQNDGWKKRKMSNVVLLTKFCFPHPHPLPPLEHLHAAATHIWTITASPRGIWAAKSVCYWIIASPWCSRPESTGILHIFVTKDKKIISLKVMWPELASS